MKLLQLMWSGVKEWYKENRNWILFLIFAFGSIGISGGVGKLLIDNPIILFIIVGIAFSLAMIFLVNYLHFLEAKEYAQEHDVFFEKAWDATKPSDDDCY